MSALIKIKRSSETSTPTSLELGELAYSLSSENLFIGDAANTPIKIGGASDVTKLSGIADNANNYVHPDNHLPSIITQDSSNRFVTDAQISTWNAKASTNVATTSTDGLLSAADKYKIDNTLNGVSIGGITYVSDIQTADFTSIKDVSYFVNGVVNITLPADPVTNTIVELVSVEAEGSVILRNGLLIMGAAEDLLIDIPNITMRLRYLNSTFGWRIT